MYIQSESSRENHPEWIILVYIFSSSFVVSSEGETTELDETQSLPISCLFCVRCQDNLCTRWQDVSFEEECKDCTRKHWLNFTWTDTWTELNYSRISLIRHFNSPTRPIIRHPPPAPPSPLPASRTAYALRRPSSSSSLTSKLIYFSIQSSNPNIPIIRHPLVFNSAGLVRFYCISTTGRGRAQRRRWVKPWVSRRENLGASSTLLREWDRNERTVCLHFSLKVHSFCTNHRFGE